MRGIPKLSAGFAVALLAYAPWHDAISLGQRTALNWKFLAPIATMGISLPGLINFLWIAVLSVVLALRLWPSFRERRPRGVEWAAPLLPLLLTANTRVWDGYSILLIANSVLLSCLLLAVVRRDAFAIEISVLRRYGYVVLLASYALAIALPLLVPIEGYEVFAHFHFVNRFRGWTGEGQPIGWLGAVLAIWSGLVMAGSPSRKLRWLAAAGVGLGILGIYLNVMRIALMATFTFFLLSAIIYRARKERVLFFGSLALLCAVLFSTGQFRLKNVQGHHHNDGSFEYSSVLNVTRIKSIKDFDKVIVTNGRAETYAHLIKISAPYRVIGLGTGESKRILYAMKPNAPEPNNDYLRMLVEHGLVGLALLLLIGGTLFWRLRATHALAALGAFATALLTDNFLIMPAIGYGPLLLVLLAAPVRREVQPARSLQSARIVAGLGLLAYGPWHDSWSLGQRLPIGGSPDGITWAGAVNMGWIALLGALFAPPLVRSIFGQRPRGVEWPLIGLPLWTLLNTRTWDAPALTGIMNVGLLSLLLLAWCRSRTSEMFAAERRVLSRWGLPVLLVSYGLSIALPLLIPIPGYDLFWGHGYERFRGWTGEGQPIGWLGFVICGWSILEILQKKRIPLGYIGCAIGLFGCFFNVLRISVLASAVLLLVAGLLPGSPVGALSRRSRVALVMAATAAVLALNFGQFAQKNIIGRTKGISLQKLPEVRSLSDIEKAIVTNGRTEKYAFLWEASKGHRLLGLGTGASKRLLKPRDPTAPEPNSDYIRILIEQGLLGLGLMLAAGLGLAWRARKTPALPLLAGFAVALATDVFLIIPTFGYVPLALALLTSVAIVRTPDRTSP